jgi:uncharacterized Zn-finger protein
LTGNPSPPGLPVFFNRTGANSIEIGVTSFECIGLPAPEDHPHIYLNMGAQADVRCPYCSTRYRHNPRLRWNETSPPGCLAAAA